MPAALPANSKTCVTLEQPARAAARIPWFQTTWAIAFSGSLLSYLAQPPLDLWPLGWVAFLPWCLLIRQPVLAGRRPYLVIWCAGFLYWFGTLHWLRLPHPLLVIGWTALSAYLAVYIQLFIGLSRVAVHHLRAPLIVAAPLVWYGLELAKGHLMSGFTMGSVCHTQIHWPAAIQIADLVGSYGVSAVLVFAAACLAQMLPWPTKTTCWKPALAALVVIGGTLGYGYFRLSTPLVIRADEIKSPRIALIQGSVRVELKFDPALNPEIIRQHAVLTQKALRSTAQPVDLVVWPETMYRIPLVSFAEDYQLPADAEMSDGSPATRDTIVEDRRYRLEQFAEAFRANLLFGVDRAHFRAAGPEHYNTAMFVHRDGTMRPNEQYDKMHLVMFGEYIPFAEYFPWLYEISPVAGGVRPGKQHVSLKIGECRIAPNLCYETAVPHQIRKQVLELRSRGEEPDVLLNVTNDAWFLGSSQIDQHLACGVFRAIECRKPLLVAANTGFSASINAYGQREWQSKRWDEDCYIAEPKIQRCNTVYLVIGELPALACLAGCFLLAVIGWQNRGIKPD